MYSNLTTSVGLTILLVYSFLNSLKSIGIINSRFIPIMGTLLGISIGFLIGLYDDPKDMLQNVVLGALAGSNSTWLDQTVKHMLSS